MDTALAVGDSSTVTFTFSEAVVGFSAADLAIENGTISAPASSDGGITWTAVLTPDPNITDVTNVITLDMTGVMCVATSTPGAGTVASNNYAVDTTRPTVAIAVNQTSLAAGQVSSVTFTFSEPVTGFTIADLTFSNGTLSALSTSDNITYTSNLTPSLNTTAATNVITLNNTGVQDTAGNAGTGTTNSNTYAIDTQRPTATILVADSALIVDETSLVTLTFSEPVTGFTAADLTIANGTLTPVSSSDGGLTWTATLTPTAAVEAATNVITLDNTGVQDAAGNAGMGTTDSNNYSVDTTRPTATIVVADTEVNAGETSQVTITFDAAVSGFTNADLTVDNGTLSAVSSSDGGTTWTATFTPTPNLALAPTNRIRLDNSGVQDASGNRGTGITDSNNYAIRTVLLTLLVTTNSDSGDDGSSVTTLAGDEIDGAGLSLREALAWARNGDTITFDLDAAASGRQGGTITLNGTQLSIDYGVSIEGDLNADHVPDITISANGLSRVLWQSSSTTGVSLRGLTLTHGYAAGGGALAVNFGSSIIVRDCIIRDSQDIGGGGGGLYAPGAIVTLINSSVTDNTSNTFGGGIRVVSNGGSLNLINSTVSGNRTNGGTANGGGIQFGGSAGLTIINSTISGNQAGGSGSVGGGLRVTSGDAAIYNSTIVGNAADDSSGGVDASGTEIIVNTVIAGNRSGAGSAPGVGGSPLASGGVALDVGGTVETATRSFFGSNVTITTNAGTANNQGTSTLLLGDLAYNFGGRHRTHQPQIGSALISAGSAADLPTDAYDLDGDGNTAEPLPWDANGNHRIATTMEIGAVEITPASVASVGSGAADGNYATGDTIAVTVTFTAPVTVNATGGTPTLTLETGSIDRAAIYVSGSGTPMLTFSYAVQAGDVSGDLDYHSTTALSLNGALIRDMNAQDAALTLPPPGSPTSLSGQKALAINPVIAPVTDTDGDGMSNDFEQTYGLDPLDPTDANQDLDGDGVTNIDEYLTGRNPTIDDHPPVLSSPAPVTIDAVGLLTPMPALTPPSAIDGHDGAVVAHLVDSPQLLEPGVHIITWQASDAAGNRGETLQAINVRPLVSLAQDQFSGEGATVPVRFLLNGTSPEYPLTVAYTVGGTASASDHDLTAGTVVFQQGEVVKTLPVRVTGDSIAEGEETIVVTLAGDGNFGARSSHVIRIVEANVAPAFDWSLTQAARKSRIVTQDGGPVTLTATVRDPNPGDAHTYEWSIPATIAVTAIGDSVRAFDPSLLAPGVYRVELRVTDNGAPVRSTHDSLLFKVVPHAAPLSASADSDGDEIDDATEGWTDADGDGQPDYLDASALPQVLNASAGDDGLFLLEADAGVMLSLGDRAFEYDADGAELHTGELTADVLQNVGGYFDLRLRDLIIAGSSVNVVIPQRQPVPARPIYRKLAHDRWITFVEDARNRLASAPGAMGVCPPPGSSDYRPGLNPGDWCVQLTLEDGGPNDDDGLANAAITDPGGVGDVTMITVRSRGGGGSMDGWMLFVLLSFAAYGAASGSRRTGRLNRTS